MYWGEEGVTSKNIYKKYSKRGIMLPAPKGIDKPFHGPYDTQLRLRVVR